VPTKKDFTKVQPPGGIKPQLFGDAQRALISRITSLDRLGAVG
jgi:hypothetical protein